MRCLLFLFALSRLIGAPIFDNVLSLSELGQRANKIPNLLPAARITSSQPLRTNDYQTLQLSQSNRSIIRMGPYLVSQAGSGGVFGNGPGVTFPAKVFVSTGTNPSLQITAANSDTLLVFGSSETATYTLSSKLGSGSGQSASFQSMDLTYTHPSDIGKWIRNSLVVGNAFFDCRYNDLSPIFTADGDTHLSEVTIFSAAFPMGKTFTPALGAIQTLDKANKLRVSLINTITNKLQEWLIYVEPPETMPAGTPEIAFEAYFNGSGPNLLESQAGADVPFTGFLRAAIVQAAPVPLKQDTRFQKALGPPSEVDRWSTALGIQIIAASPASMYVLWPKDFRAGAVTKIRKNMKDNQFLPFCPWIANFLPLIALEDSEAASGFFYALQDRGASGFGLGVNPFLGYFNVLFGKYQASSIDAYQQKNRSYPSYTLSASASSIESVYDAYRSVIPLSAEVSFLADSYTWTYTVVNGSDPLIVFPRYKQLDASSSLPQLKSDFIVKDPFKGDLLAVEAASNSVTFSEGPSPSFLNQGFIPDGLFSSFSQDETRTLIDLFQKEMANFSPGIVINNTNLIYTIGQVAYKWASTVRYGAYLMGKMGKSAAEIKTLTSPVMTALKSFFEEWMINRQKKVRDANGGSLPDSATAVNFFVGDSTNPAVSADLSGMNNQNPGTNFGNAFYNDHHLQYGYWLGVAAYIVEWDNTYNSSNPWIATTKLTATGAGPYKMKRFVDLLWRDTRNPDTEDPDLPFNRHGNIWEGHSTALGIVPTLAQTNGRNQESLAEDFNCWLQAYFYASEVLKSTGLTSDDLKGFDTLVDFCELGLRLAATGGNVYYNTPNWPYANRPGLNFNVAIANIWDSLVDMNTFFPPGTPPCKISAEDMVFSQSRLNAFFENYLEDEKQVVDQL
ncbi:MAG: glycosyl hydrolase [Simkaniaceae bacterium]